MDPQEVLHRATVHLRLQQAEQEIVRLQAQLARSNIVIPEEESLGAVSDETTSPPSPISTSGSLSIDLAEMIESFEDVVFSISGLTQDILFINSAAEALFGYSKSVFLNQKQLWKRVIHAEDLQKVELSLQALKVKQKVEVEYRIFRDDDTMRWVRARFYGIYQANQLDHINGIISDVTERKQTEEQLRRKALFDDLTQIPNRTLLLQQLEEALNRTIRSAHYQFAVLFVDLSYFKQINDTFGHLVGDKLLVSVAKILKNCIRPVDMVARFGGDEFTIFLDDIENVAYAAQVANRIFEALSTPVCIESYRLYINASIGITIGNRSYLQIDDLLRDADMAMYRAKKKGEGEYDFFSIYRTVRWLGITRTISRNKSYVSA